MLKDGDPQPPLWRGFMDGEINAVRLYCRCDARQSFRDCAPNCGSSVQFQAGLEFPPRWLHGVFRLKILEKVHQCAPSHYCFLMYTDFEVFSMLIERVPHPPPPLAEFLWIRISGGGFCGCDARLSYRGWVRNCGCSVQFQVLCLISPSLTTRDF